MKRFAAGLLALLVLAGLSLPATASSITTRAGKGSALTASELDANFKRAAQTKSSNYTVVESDNRDTIEVSASATITLTAAATLLAASDPGDFQVTLKNTHASATVTVARSGSDTINGATSYTLYPGGAATFKINNAGNGWNVTSATEMPAFFPNVSGQVTATQTELNYTDVTTLGTTQASKAVTTDSSGNILFMGTANKVSGTGLDWLFNESDQSSGTRLWGIHVNGGALSIRVCDDANSTCEDAFRIQRSAGTVSETKFDNGTVTVDENLGVSGTSTLSTVDINGGAIDATTLGASTPSSGVFTTLQANGNTTLGDATSDTITATGRFNSNLLPSTDNARDLGSSGNSWKDLYIDGTATLATASITTATAATSTVSGELYHTKGCNSGYTRAGVGYCARSNSVSPTSLTRDSCTQIAAPSGSGGSRIAIKASSMSGDALANRSATVTVYSDASCTVFRGEADASCYEDSSTSAGRTICTANNVVDVAGTTIYAKLTDDAGNAGTGTYYIEGYWDAPSP